ncbi:hypothetical protein [Mangrovimonas spongiae]|uniref:Lipoprotein n=1 Tax=Mangrovimonas spongiae TaxID=2494697 RepID=A0A428JYN2_9FLAO|nr:hypothetical protein [Mangrovimonas spongiae]RSK39261.1 hypothetical protein EJA19_10030 [Mangrovimonas spongiae]
MKSLLKITLCLLLLNVLSCKNEPSVTLDYKYSDKENPLKCDGLDTKIYNEALLSFEEDIISFYDKENKNLTRAYSMFFRNASTNRIKFQDVASLHSVNILKVLKNEKGLWKEGYTLNFNHKLFNCLGDNFKDKDLQTTFNALISANSLTPELFGAPLRYKVSSVSRDRYLAAFFALEYYYSYLSQVDPLKIDETKTHNNSSDEATRLKELKKTQKSVDPHAGHNH